MQPVDLRDFMEELGEKAGEAILPFFRTSLSVSNKAHGGDKKLGGDFDPVTEADRAAELVIRRHIEAHFPQHGILGEEFGANNENAEYLWVIDPIDGTRAFLCGLPLWGVLIGLMRNGSPALGMMYQPYTGEMFVGNGHSAELKRNKTTRNLQTRRCAHLSDAYLMTTSPDLFAQPQRAAYNRVEEQVKLARYGADCYAYAMLASGQVDLVIESGLKPHDIVALIPVIEGAGGIITNWQGGSAASGGDIIAAGDKRLHEAALAKLTLITANDENDDGA